MLQQEVKVGIFHLFETLLDQSRVLRRPSMLMGLHFLGIFCVPCVRDLAVQVAIEVMFAATIIVSRECALLRRPRGLLLMRRTSAVNKGRVEPHAMA